MDSKPEIAAGQDADLRLKLLSCNILAGGSMRGYRDYVTHDARFDRPAEVDLLVGDASKARTKLGWEPTVHFQQLVEMMVAADLARHAAAK